MTTTEHGAGIVANARDAVAEISELVSAVDPAQLAAVQSALLDARKVYLTGSGRSGLMARAVAMRLMHIGLSCFAVGEIATPAIEEGDLLIAFSARGGSAIVGQMSVARKVGATVAAFSSSPATAVAEAADLVVVVPAKTSVKSVQHAGSLFEQGCLVIGDALCRSVQSAVGAETEQLNQRHANLA